MLGISTRQDSPHLKVDVDEQFMWKAEMNTGQCNNSLLDAKLGSTLLVEDSGTHVSILSSLTETSHLMVLCQLIVYLHSKRLHLQGALTQQSAAYKWTRVFIWSFYVPEFPGMERPRSRRNGNGAADVIAVI